MDLPDKRSVTPLPPLPPPRACFRRHASIRGGGSPHGEARVRAAFPPLSPSSWSESGKRSRPPPTAADSQGRGYDSRLHNPRAICGGTKRRVRRVSGRVLPRSSRVVGRRGARSTRQDPGRAGISHDLLGHLWSTGRACYGGKIAATWITERLMPSYWSVTLCGAAVSIERDCRLPDSLPSRSRILVIPPSLSSVAPSLPPFLIRSDRWSTHANTGNAAD